MGALMDKDDEAKNRQQRTMKQLYLDKEETGDVTFIVESEKIRAHKCVLAAISPKYKAQFYGIQPDTGDIIVKDVTAAAFGEFLQFFYLEKADLTVENIEDVLNLAKASLVEEFVDQCVAFLSTEVNDACLVYRLATFHDIKELEELCLFYISENTMKVFKSDGFLMNCNREMLQQILRMDSLACKETDVFDACISWAKAVCSEKNVDAEKAVNLRAELGDVIKEIRFRSMTIEQFVHLHSLYEGFLTPEESMEIVYMLGNLKDFKSNKFNSNVRNEDLQLNRIVREEEREITPVYIVPVTFSCSKPIRFKGFATGFAFDGNHHIIRIKITGEDALSTEYMPKYTIQRQKETIVTFDKPIDIQPNNRVEVALDLPNMDHTTKYWLAKVMELDGIEFSFKTQDDNAPGILLTRLFFNRIR